MALKKAVKQNLVERVMNEQVECGGQLYTRGQLYTELIAEGHPHQYVDAFVFGYLKRVETATSDSQQEGQEKHGTAN